MENLDIIILTSIVSTLFIVFGIVMYKELKNAPDQSKDLYERSPRANMIRFVGSIFDDNAISKKEKKVIYKAVKRTISDMESDGMYFPEEVKERLQEYREEMHCEYSGLPSPKAYESINNVISKQNVK
jgi:hypothetical protein